MRPGGGLTQKGTLLTVNRPPHISRSLSDAIDRPMENLNMHEWVLVSVQVDWESGRAVFVFDTFEAGRVSLIAMGVTDVHVPRMGSWGSSVYVNQVRELTELAHQLRTVEIEMQSGDVITVTASSFIYPDVAKDSIRALATAEQQEGS